MKWTMSNDIQIKIADFGISFDLTSVVLREAKKHLTKMKEGKGADFSKEIKEQTTYKGSKSYMSPEVNHIY